MPVQANTTTPLFNAILTPIACCTGVAPGPRLTVLLFAAPGLLFLSLGAFPVSVLMGLTALAIVAGMVCRPTAG
ncbi:MAG: hypothetical protein MO846_07720 [Candidatus Devosia symbiotica]|nr:hypothetical protein [Candidatus Devosia symbiotica]